MTWIYDLRAEGAPEPEQVGGKAASLMTMTRSNLPVPPGFVLAVAFFEPWIEAIRGTPEWAGVVASAPSELRQRCDAVKALAMTLELDPERREALEDALASLDPGGGGPLLAVRSSSPEEDRELDSFAGAYETVLGVRPEEAERAIRRAFVSCLDERVLAYKRAHGFALDRPRIAVIVQQQIAAEAAGVAFSLNPLNNCYDQAVINANFGLGESVVSGVASPDTFTVDKPSRTILERTVGKKETSTWLDDEGGTHEAPSPHRAGLCLSDAQVLALTDLLIRVEESYDKPVDVEWAFVGPTLYLLQARPITAYVPLPDRLRTAPGEPKRLYLDLTMVKWGMEERVSVMGTDYLQITNTEMLRFSMGEGIGPEIVDAVRVSVEGRTYLVISNSLRMQGKKRVVGELKEMDPLCAETIEALDEAEYIPAQLPPPLRGLLFKMLRQNLGLGWQVIQAIRDPEASKRRYLAEEQRLREELAREVEGEDAPGTAALATRLMRRMISYTKVFMPMLFAAIMARARMKRVFEDSEPEIGERLVYLERALPHNVTIEMGLAMVRLARTPEITACASGDEFVARLEARDFPPAFLEAWDAFMGSYGCRAPMEMDPAAPRFREEPARFYEQLRALAAHTGGEQDPQALSGRAQTEREAAYRVLLQAAERKGKRRAKAFERAYRTWVDLGGYRETPKYYYAWIADLFRLKMLRVARSLVDAGRLDAAEQVFDLHMDELDRGLADPGVDLRALAERNTHTLSRLSRARSLPRIVDSRGKILRAPLKEAREGELVGEPISPGVVRGPVKVLHAPDEKPVLPGEILVTRATDPGWTPLFIHAAGVVLEIGGMLQHGALVAREYGKPCVSGLENVTELLADGQIVELDGTNGIVRHLAPGSLPVQT